MIQIFFLDEKGEWGEKGEWREIKDLYWFEEEGVHFFGEANHYGQVYDFKILVDGVQVHSYTKPEKLLIQLHHQFKDGSTNMCAQREIKDYEGMGSFLAGMRIFLEETEVGHPLPKNAQWLACTEKDKHFVGVPA